MFSSSVAQFLSFSVVQLLSCWVPQLRAALFACISYSFLPSVCLFVCPFVCPLALPLRFYFSFSLSFFVAVAASCCLEGGWRAPNAADKRCY